MRLVERVVHPAPRAQRGGSRPAGSRQSRTRSRPCARGTPSPRRRSPNVTTTLPRSSVDGLRPRHGLADDLQHDLAHGFFVAADAVGLDQRLERAEAGRLRQAPRAATPAPARAGPRRSPAAGAAGAGSPDTRPPALRARRRRPRRPSRPATARRAPARPSPARPPFHPAGARCAHRSGGDVLHAQSRAAAAASCAAASPAAASGPPPIVPAPPRGSASLARAGVTGPQTMMRCGTQRLDQPREAAPAEDRLRHPRDGDGRGRRRGGRPAAHQFHQREGVRAALRGRPRHAAAGQRLRALAQRDGIEDADAERGRPAPPSTRRRRPRDPRAREPGWPRRRAGSGAGAWTAWP